MYADARAVTDQRPAVDEDVHGDSVTTGDGEG